MSPSNSTQYVSIIATHQARMRCILNKLVRGKIHRFKNTAIIRMSIMNTNDDKQKISCKMVYDGELDESKPDRKYYVKSNGTEQENKEQENKEQENKEQENKEQENKEQENKEQENKEQENKEQENKEEEEKNNFSGFLKNKLKNLTKQRRNTMRRIKEEDRQERQQEQKSQQGDNNDYIPTTFPTISDKSYDIIFEGLSDGVEYIFYIIRHGQAEHNILKGNKKKLASVMGNKDTCLRDNGIEQARRAGEALKMELIKETLMNELKNTNINRDELDRILLPSMENIKDTLLDKVNDIELDLEQVRTTLNDTLNAIEKPTREPEQLGENNNQQLISTLNNTTVDLSPIHGILNDTLNLEFIKKVIRDNLEEKLKTVNLRPKSNSDISIHLEDVHLFASDLYRTHRTLATVLGVLNSNGTTNLKSINILPCSHEVTYKKDKLCDDLTGQIVQANENISRCRVPDECHTTITINDGTNKETIHREDEERCSVYGDWWHKEGKEQKGGGDDTQLTINWSHYKEFYNGQSRANTSRIKNKCKSTLFINEAVKIINQNNNIVVEDNDNIEPVQPLEQQNAPQAGGGYLNTHKISTCKINMKEKIIKFKEKNGRQYAVIEDKKTYNKRTVPLSLSNNKSNILEQSKYTLKEINRTRGHYNTSILEHAYNHDNKVSFYKNRKKYEYILN
jgi:hypothetical protein